MKNITLLLLALICSPVNAALETLDNEQLSEVRGQSGANIELELRLNQTITGSPTAPTSVTKLCTDPLDCRLGIKFNNRTPWLVFKGISGGIYIPQISLDGSDISFTGTAGVEWLSAIKIGFGGAANKIRFDNFGFEAMSAESDIGGTEGYRVLTEKDDTATTPKFVDGKYTTAGFDFGREVGFLGLNINGNVAINGTIKMFSCPATHPRCS